MDAPCEWAPSKSQEYKRVYEAVIKGDRQALQAVWTKNIRPNALYGGPSEGRSLLHYAAGKGYHAIINFLLVRGANANIQSRNQFGCCGPLFDAANGGHYEATQRLVDAGADISATGPDDETVLSTVLRNVDVVETRHWKIINLLLDRGIDINARGTDLGSTVLEYAVRLNNLELIEHLHHRGASLTGSLPCAIGFSNLNTLKFLLRLRATDSSFAALKRAAALNKASSARLLLQRARRPFSTGVTDALTMAALSGATETLILMLDEFDLRVNATDSRGATALHACCRAENPNMQTFKALFDRGAEVRAKVQQVGAETGRGSLRGRRSLFAVGDTPLHCVSHRSSLPMIQRLLCALPPASLGISNAAQTTPLHAFAARINSPVSPRTPTPGEPHSRVEAMRLLLTHSAFLDLDTRDAMGRTALHLVVLAGPRDVTQEQLAVVKMLVEQGADITAVDRDGKKAVDLLVAGSGERRDEVRAVLTGRRK